ncbi:ubiquinol-cytochrome C chaperone [Microvirga tunisiensis]|uniref:Ubiquinol-cytochrome C chaperone n=2 Tax=Pannonibacter tanglangensis TaxID=2750084 RepID=A0A7X5F1R4_9HYPH|nr:MULTISPECIES: ubiquinol-cytochrome C chaperone family protein [unclassified Pannonibacter]NBN62516.1 ubiquinol-cytochrome C chaperone [Pannonibacter sp. XCT-34]NBN78171.1 ubiquinol-cytochrome C chaperone [Pannonibacter sp. XCT-53]
MVFGLFRRRTQPSEYALYGAIVAQARQPELYSRLGVPDTIDGRFDMMILHAVLLFRRLQGEGKEVAAVSQSVFDIFFADMDGSLREMGISDNAVPKKVKRMAEAFYGRAAAYGAALDAGDVHALAAAIDRNVFADASSPASALALAHYAVKSAAQLSAAPVKEILAARLPWPAPGEAASAGGKGPAEGGADAHGANHV